MLALFNADYTELAKSDAGIPSAGLVYLRAICYSIAAIILSKSEEFSIPSKNAIISLKVSIASEAFVLTNVSIYVCIFVTDCYIVVSS